MAVEVGHWGQTVTFSDAVDILMSLRMQWKAWMVGGRAMTG